VKRKRAGGNQPAQSRPQAQSQPGTINSPQMGTATRSAIIELVIPSLFFGQGFALIPFDFWAGIVCMAIALLLFWGLLFRVFHRNKLLKICTGVIVSAAVYGVILWIIFRPPDIRIDLFSKPGNYPEGTDIMGSSGDQIILNWVLHSSTMQILIKLTWMF
jgi:hypothetical protein